MHVSATRGEKRSVGTEDSSNVDDGDDDDDDDDDAPYATRRMRERGADETEEGGRDGRRMDRNRVLYVHTYGRDIVVCVVIHSQRVLDY